MRHILTSLALLATFAAVGQSTMPYNPDADDDSYIGVADILGLLPLYGQQFGIDSSLTCDYDGTPFEQILGGIWDGTIIVDSIRAQYHLEDSAQVFMPGCPEPVWESASFEATWVGYPSFQSNDWYFYTSDSPYKYLRMQFYEGWGWYSFRFSDPEIYSLGLGAILGNEAESWALGNVNQAWTLPFDSLDYTYSEFGVQFTDFDGFMSSQTYNSILFYWHYAE
jgi:hypothetical protein